MVEVDVEHLPNDTERLHRLILQLLGERGDKVLALADRARSYQVLREQYELLRQMYFGRSSEKLTPQDIRQMHLFNEAESGFAQLHALTPEQAATVPVAQHVRKKPG